ARGAGAARRGARSPRPQSGAGRHSGTDRTSIGPSGEIVMRSWNNSWEASWLPAPARSAAPGGALAMVSRNAEHVDVFWSAQDGGVQARSWNGSGPIADSDPNRHHHPHVAHRDHTRGRQERAMV